MKQSSGGYSYIVTNSEINPDNVPQGERILSGVILNSEKEVAPFLEGKHIDDIAEREFTFEATIQRGDKGDITWIKAQHADVGDFLARMDGVRDENTKMSPLTVYLADTDANRFLAQLKSLDIHYDVDVPYEDDGSSIKTVKQSRITQYQKFEFSKLLRSYYVGREFGHEENESIAKITGIKTQGRKTTTFLTFVNGRQHEPTLPLDVFSQRYLPIVPESEKDLPTQIDFMRYAHLGVHKLVPSPDDSEYLNCLTKTEVSERTKATVNEAMTVPAYSPY